jgi:putative FmdB family regulatory protein
MPLYEYHCSKCAKTFEVMRKFSDPPLIEHEGCGGALERLLSAPAFKLKGTGWYATDYAKSGAKAPSEAAETKADDSKSADAKDSQNQGEGKSAGDKLAETKTETKSETKADLKPSPASTKSD